MSDVLCYEINSPAAAAEILDGEAIILHLRHGHYFSAEGSGALIWAGIEQRLPLGTIASILADRFKIATDAARPAVDLFVGQLMEHDLIRTASPAGEAAVDLEWLAVGDYAPPKLEIYTDMQDIMQLDPIHDVDEKGWPIAPGQAY